jgi:hypothetical protein
LIKRLIQTKEALTNIMGMDAEGNIVAQGPRKLTGLSPLEAVQIKREIGKMTKFTGNPSDDAVVNKSLKKVFGGIKGKVNESVPEAIPLNERISDLIGAEAAFQNRDMLLQRQNILSLTDTISGAAGGLGTMNPLGALAGMALSRAIRSTPAKTGLAAAMMRGADVAERGLSRLVPLERGVSRATSRLGQLAQKRFLNTPS